MLTLKFELPCLNETLDYYMYNVMSDKEILHDFLFGFDLDL